MSFTWTFSKIENFETCAKKYYEYMVAKSVKDTDTENLDWGNTVHDAFRDTLKGKKELPDFLKSYQPWIDRVHGKPGDLYVEQKYGITSDLSPCPYLAPVVWYRGIADVVRVWDDVAYAGDWKTGKRKEGSIQLALMALCIFQHFPKVKVVCAEFIWLQEAFGDPKAITKKTYRREEMVVLMAEIMPRVQKLEWAHKTMTFPPNPSGLCMKYCEVVSCPFYKKGNK